ncbi:MAG: DUF4149 domain-containing protein [Neisseria sp.]|uniref:DUF4149 domain-containing protein n=1 Tax=Neisseria sp. TaxID=192066 RepID=UPI0026DAD7DB|nr:DUF4149 domain-containing protein [Neisseria sp.]MDO4640998.1 DUF4149 domain-containing protein [Neisseria sp.]
MNRLTALIAGSWLGMQVLAGYVAAPILFKNLEKMQAGELAGKLFTIVGYYGLAAWFLVYIVARMEAASAKPRRWIALQIVLIGINQLLIHPVIQAVKYGQDHPLRRISHHFSSGSCESSCMTEFAFWHGFSSLLYMTITVLGLFILSVFLRLSFQSKRTQL